MTRRALLLVDRRSNLSNGAIVQIKVWQLPEPTKERPHALKYSLFFGRPGERIVGYDNEVGKGDHRHYREKEDRYHFRSLEQLIRDFLDDVEKELRNE